MEMVVLPMYDILYDNERTTVKRDLSRGTDGTSYATGSSAGRLRSIVPSSTTDWRWPRALVVDGRTPDVLHVFPLFFGR